MLKLHGQLAIDSCPHCGRANPTLNKCLDFVETNNNEGNEPRWWGFYICKSCGGVVTAYAPKDKQHHNQPDFLPVINIYPFMPTISDSIPAKPREFLRQAQNCLHAPAAAIMACASAIDAMLKAKSLIAGSLYTRIDKAAEDHLITAEMAKWAHQIRLDANEQRHADENAPLPNDKDARLVFDFAIFFAQYLFVLPAMVSHGISEAESKTK